MVMIVAANNMILFYSTMRRCAAIRDGCFSSWLPTFGRWVLCVVGCLALDGFLAGILTAPAQNENHGFFT